MQTKLVKMGNSHGVRLPKAILKQTGILDHVELTVEDNKVVIAPAQNPRAGWAEAIDPKDAEEDEFLWEGFVETDDLSWWTWDDDEKSAS